MKGVENVKKENDRGIMRKIQDAVIYLRNLRYALVATPSGEKATKYSRKQKRCKNEKKIGRKNFERKRPC